MTKSLIISTIHATVSVLSVCIFFARYTVDLTKVNRIVSGGLKGTGDEVMVYSICYSIGYLIYDFLVMIFYKSVRMTSAMVHHVIILGCFLPGIEFLN